MSEADFKRVVEEGRALQQIFPDLGLVAVGGTAAALHCHHRVSLDVDEVTSRLRQNYEQITARLEQWEGWTTNRKNPPVLILGERHGVELGLRQQRRTAPIETCVVEGLTIPTAAETLRMKAFLLTERRATRDYIDVAALAQSLGEASALQALSSLNALYSTATVQTPITRLAETCEGDPVDLLSTPLHAYRGLKPPFTHWPFVAAACRRLARTLLKRELGGELPPDVCVPTPEP